MLELRSDVCIIGAGVAGLSAANHLLALAKSQSKSIAIIVVESRNRPGGRTHSVCLGDNLDILEIESSVNISNLALDIGGQWIGDDHKKVLVQLEKHCIDLEEQYYPHFESESTNCLASLVSMVSYKFPDLLEEEEIAVAKFFSVVDELGSKLSRTTPWDIDHADDLDQSIYDYVVQHVETPRAQQEILIFIQTILACVPEECSFLFFLYYIHSGGGMRALGDGIHGAQRSVSKLKHNSFLDNSLF